MKEWFILYFVQIPVIVPDMIATTYSVSALVPTSFPYNKNIFPLLSYLYITTKHLVSLAIRDLQVKLLWDFNLLHQNGQSQQTNKYPVDKQCWRGCRERRSLLNCWDFTLLHPLLKSENSLRAKSRSTICPACTTPWRMSKRLDNLLYRYLLSLVYYCSTDNG